MARRSRRYAYGPYVDGPDPLAPPVDIREALDSIGRELLDQRFQGMKQAMENATPEDVERIREMLDDLNDLLANHAAGQDTTEQFQQFMQQHGEFFPENPQNTEELIDLLAQRAAA